MTDRDQELMQAALFDELDAAQQDEFEELLQRSPEARRKYEGMRRLAELAEDTPLAAAPEDLARRIMEGLPERAESLTSRPTSLLRDLTIRCPYYFVLAGMLHILLGATLQNLLRLPQAGSQTPAWVLWQPEFAFITGAFFLICGALLLMRAPQAGRISYGGLFFYIAFVGLNGLALQLQLKQPQLLPGLLAFAGMGLTIAALLGALLQQYNKEQGNAATQNG